MRASLSQKDPTTSVAVSRLPTTAGGSTISLTGAARFKCGVSFGSRLNTIIVLLLIEQPNI